MPRDWCRHEIKHWYDVRTMETVLQHEGQPGKRYPDLDLPALAFGIQSLPGVVIPQVLAELGCPDVPN